MNETDRDNENDSEIHAGRCEHTHGTNRSLVGSEIGKKRPPGYLDVVDPV